MESNASQLSGFHGIITDFLLAESNASQLSGFHGIITDFLPAETYITFTHSKKSRDALILYLVMYFRTEYGIDFRLRKRTNSEKLK